MGGCWSQEPEVDFDGPVDFYHFYILRAIGKGAFGKVCIVKKRDTKQMYAMKYMNKVQIIKKHAVENVFREIKLLRYLEHPFLVNMWFTFQDREDIFLVLDLMLGGDLSYHLEKEGRFQVPRVRLYIAQLALALQYLKGKLIIHRDVKPANMLLDSQGHIHLTDFNVACVVKPDMPILSITGTKPYMAPEVLRPSSAGYSYAVDWWSLGVSAYEMLRGQRPFPLDRHMSNDEIFSQLRHTRPSASARWDQTTCDVLKMLLHPDDDKRLQSVEVMMSHPFFEGTNWEEVESKEVIQPFIPPQNRINCDPTHELEEMIVEPNPLHKKQHRLSKRTFRPEEAQLEEELDRVMERFQPYDRLRLKKAEEDKLLEQQLALEEKEREGAADESETTPTSEATPIEELSGGTKAELSGGEAPPTEGEPLSNEATSPVSVVTFTAELESAEDPPTGAETTPTGNEPTKVEPFSSLEARTLSSQSSGSQTTPTDLLTPTTDTANLIGNHSEAPPTSAVTTPTSDKDAIQLEQQLSEGDIVVAVSDQRGLLKQDSST